MAIRNYGEIGQEVVDRWGPTQQDINNFDSEKIQCCLLAALVVEMQKLIRLLSCPNFTQMPFTLRQIRANTAKPKKRKAVKRRQSPKR